MANARSDPPVLVSHRDLQFILERHCPLLLSPETTRWILTDTLRMHCTDGLTREVPLHGVVCELINCPVATVTDPDDPYCVSYAYRLVSFSRLAQFGM